MDRQIERQILDLLKKHNVMTLATVRSDGWPQATTVAYVNDRLTIYVTCGADSQKLANIRQHNKVSLTIDRDYDDWTQIKGLSMAAVAEEAKSEVEMQFALRLMGQKFPQAAEMVSPEQLRHVAVLKITPRLVSVLDYTKGFGHTELVKA